MPTKDLAFVFLGEDKTASKVMSDVAKNAEKATSRIGSAFGKVGDIVGGEFGEVLNKAGEGLSQVGERSGKMSTSLLVGGGVVTGLGIALQTMGAKDKQANDQLQRSIKDSGHSWDSYKEQVEGVIGKQENFGHTAADTQGALQKITQATGDPSKALANMGLVANIAADRHISLTDASRLLVKILEGKGTRTLADYGVVMGKSADKTKNVDDAVSALSKKLDGQASASMDNFGGFVRQVKTHLEDFGATVGQAAGPILTVLGPALMSFGVVMDLVRARKEAATAASLVLAAATDVETVATDGAAVAQAGLNVAFLVSPVGLLVAGVAALAVTMGIVALSTQSATTQTESYSDALKADNGVIGDNTRAQAAKILVESGAMKSAEELGISADVLTSAATGNAKAADLVTASLDKQNKKVDDSISMSQRQSRYGVVLTDVQKEQKAKIAEVGKAFGDQTDEIKKNLDQTAQVTSALPAVTTAAEDTANGLGLTASAFAALTKTQDATTASAKSWKTQIDILNGGAQSLEQANISVAANYQSTTKTIRDNIASMGKAAATSLDINTAGGLANHGIVLKAIQDAQDQSDAIIKSEGGGAKAREDGRLALEAQRVSIGKHMTDLGLDAGAVQTLIDTEMAIPPHIQTQIEVDTAEALAQIGRVRDALKAAQVWARTSVGVNLGAIDPSTPAWRYSQPHAALGGIVTRPTSILAGESGPEAIIPLSAGSGLKLGGGGGLTVNITVAGTFAGDQNTLAKTIVTAITNAARQGAIPKNSFSTALTGH